MFLQSLTNGNGDAERDVELVSEKGLEMVARQARRLLLLQ
jgi:hypothetical protein